MTDIKLVTALAGLATQSLYDLATPLFNHPGKKIIGIAEFEHVGRYEPAPDQDKPPIVNIQIKAIEVANSDQADQLRQAMAALYRHRTAQGTIDEALEPALSETTIADLAGALDGIEAARLRVACQEWSDYIAKVIRGNPSKSALMDELRTVQMGLGNAIARGV